MSFCGQHYPLYTVQTPHHDHTMFQHKKAVVVTSRVHPGESNSSWMMKGFLDYLTGSSADAKVASSLQLLSLDGVVWVTLEMNADGDFTVRVHSPLPGDTCIVHILLLPSFRQPWL